MKAADLFVQCLEEEKVEYIFAVPGEENLHVLEALRKSKIKVIVNRHEQAAAFMAATYGRLTGKAGVVMSTLGPGATNLVTGVAHAQLGGMPLIVITGQKGIRENWQGNFQVVDVVQMMRPITKYTAQIISPKSIPKEVRNAFKLATSERQGVCHLELPEDVADEEVKGFTPQPAIALRRPIADSKSIKIAADEIKKAKKAVIIVSSRAQRTRVKDALEEFCDATNLYVIHTQLGKGVLRADHPNCLHSFGIHKKDYVNCLLEKADLIITVGYSTAEYPPYVWNAEGKKKILHIDFNPARNDTFYAPIGEVIGDIATSLDSLREALQSFRNEGSFEEQLKKELEKKLFKNQNDDDSYPLKPRRIVADCRKALGKEDILCLDNGIYKLWFSRHYPAYDIGTFLLDNTLATMGAGLPSAMTAKLISPYKKVLAVVGDGGFMMNSQELETAVRLKLNVVILILNDNAYGFIKWKQQQMNYADFSLDYGNPDFVKYAESYGAHGFKVKKASDLLKILEKAFQLQGPVVIECPIDYSENKKTWGEELSNVVCPS